MNCILSIPKYFIEIWYYDKQVKIINTQEGFQGIIDSDDEFKGCGKTYKSIFFDYSDVEMIRRRTNTCLVDCCTICAFLGVSLETT